MYTLPAALPSDLFSPASLFPSYLFISCEPSPMLTAPPASRHPSCLPLCHASYLLLLLPLSPHTSLCCPQSSFSVIFAWHVISDILTLYFHAIHFLPHKHPHMHRNRQMHSLYSPPVLLFSSYVALLILLSYTVSLIPD